MYKKENVTLRPGTNPVPLETNAPLVKISPPVGWSYTSGSIALYFLDVMNFIIMYFSLTSNIYLDWSSNIAHIDEIPNSKYVIIQSGTTALLALCFFYPSANRSRTPNL